MTNFNEKYTDLWKLVDRMNGIKEHDQRCSERADDWAALWQQIKILPHGRILHKAWNIIVEEWRRLTGKCPKHDEHEGGV